MIHKELAKRLRLEVKDDRIGDVSITSVEVSRDLKCATITYMPLGGGDPTPEMQEGVELAAKQLRGPIGRALRLRHAPELVFEPDTHTEAAIRVTRLLDRLKAERAGAFEEEE
jgi:ribosome-binding factor A